MLAILCPRQFFADAVVRHVALWRLFRVLERLEPFEDSYGVGLGIHEMGTARMGRDRKTSVLNGNNQVWGAENVFVTDGAFMTSSACQNPSLTYMALTARAADHAVKELNKQNL